MDDALSVPDLPETTEWGLREVKVGDDVLVHRKERRDPPTILKVKGVTAERITLEDGSEWTRAGRTWSDPTAWPADIAGTILDLAAVQTQVAHEQYLRRLDTLRRVVRTRAQDETWGLSEADCHAILAIFEGLRE